MVVETQSIPQRSEIPVQDTWDLTLVYSDDEAWEKDVAELEAMQQSGSDMPAEIASLQGTMVQGPDALLRVLKMRDRVAMKAGQIRVYASMRRDSDGSDPTAQAMATRAGSLIARVAGDLAWIEPEILAIEPETLQRWMSEEQGLRPYSYFLEHLIRQRAHVRSAEVEAVMAQYSDITSAPNDAYEALTYVDLIFPTIEGSDGQPIQLSQARYASLLRNTDRRVRRDAFTNFLSTYGRYRTTTASTLGAAVRANVLGARLHNYSSALEAALAPNDIPVEVYHNLLTTVDANLDRLHRYVRVRRRIMGYDDLHVYDLYAPLVPEVEAQVRYPEGRDMVLKAFTPLGSRYGEVVQQALDSRWIDVYENQGKQSGAYSSGSYTTPPYILLNYQDKLQDVYTLAHELGHSMHSFFTHQAQPFISGSYTIFVAEVASTLNEALLTDYLLHTTEDRNLRTHLIVEQLDGIRGTLFRQTQFAQFELDMHRQVEEGQALTADWLCQRYREIEARYYGPDLALDDDIQYEWSYIPHFYFDFYVYQYATGISAALALAEQILHEGQPAVDRYLRFLHSGSSGPPIELLRDAGVDMTSPEPIQQALDRFDRLVDELEAAMA